MDTTRSYPRTTIEAFKGPDYANAVEGPTRRHPADKWINRVYLVAVIVVILSIAFVGAPA